MDSDSEPEPVYEEFEVHTEWVHGVADDTLIAYLPGFRKEKIRIQVTRKRNLRISGERPIGDNKFSRFSKEIPIPSNCDDNKIRANFSGGMLHVKHPKLIVPADENKEQAKPSGESDQKPAPQPSKPADVPQKQNNSVEKTPPKDTMEKQAGDEKTDGIAKEADNVSEKAPDKEKERKDKSNIAANESDKPMEKERKGWDQEEKTSTSDKREKLGDSVQDAAEKENIEPKKLDGTD
ncbi:hypothetical protein CRYUN_Cryun11dG0099000 [Craigia yunnanensis]